MSQISEATIKEHSVVLYEQDGEAILALVTGYKDTKYSLLNERGRNLELSVSRLTAFQVFSASVLSSTEKRNFLESLGKQLVKIADSINIEELWQTVADYGQSYSSEQLSELCFGKASPEQHLATHLRLLNQKTYFKRDKHQFEPRNAEIVAELKKAEDAQKHKIELRRVFADWLKQRQTSTDSAPVPAEVYHMLNLLKLYAVHAALTPAEEREARETTELALMLLERTGAKATPISAYSLLEKIKIFDNSTDPAWIRSRLPGPLESDPDSYELCRKSLIADSQRVDLRHLDCFTIDDVSTHDMDDALSLEIVADGYCLGIHISDVASYVPIGSEADAVFSRRLSSVYLPGKTIHMLPENLSREFFSLLVGCDRAALSLMIQLDKNYQVKTFSFLPSVIKVNRRWSYKQVDEMLHSTNSEFNTFYELASSLEAARLEKGAVQVTKQELAINVDQNGIVEITQVEEHGPARSIIAEMAILYNQLCADYLSRNAVPAIFRGQPPAEIVDREMPEQGRAKDYFMRVRLKPSMLSTTPSSHSSLGLSEYLQATSPIRRYSDLVNQRQLLSRIVGQKIPYQREDLEKLIEHSEEGLSRISKVSKESRRFWLLRYLEQRVARNSGGQGRRISGVIVKTAGKYPLLELDEVFFCSPLRSKRQLKVGEVIKAEILAIDARQDFLRLEAL